MTFAFRTARLASLAFIVGTTIAAHAQQEFPPPQGKGRVVVMSSGKSGPEHYAEVAKETAALGYDVVLFDGNTEEFTKGEGVLTHIQQAMTMPHALPGKVALVGFSLGGGEQLYWGTKSSEQVAGAIAWYPANQFIKDVPGFAQRLAVPVVVFAGGKDKYRHECCTAAKDQELQQASKAAGKSLDLTVYPDAEHDFVKNGEHYNAKDYADAFQRMSEALKQFFAN
jgi:alpha-beta hydrolase superfamily lysophospholipase